MNEHSFIIRSAYRLSTAIRVPAGGCLFALDPGLDDVGRASDPWGYFYGMGGAVVRTGPAFHAGVVIDNGSLVIFYDKHTVRTYGRTRSTADAGFGIETEC